MTVRESAYDEVVDSARDFSVLLSAMSRPAMIHDLGVVAIHPPAGFSNASASVALALLSEEATFATLGLSEYVTEYIAVNTRAARAEIDAAGFLFFATADRGEKELAAANRGDLQYPELGATIVAQLADLSSEPLPDSIRVHAQGPGIDGAAVFYAKGLHRVWLATLRGRNVEYPLGVDAILTCGNRIVCLPRSTSFQWASF
jgi:alpha-D-ribose 1-methylphosphonate 5-triphosphate synthase subunit PhnH